MSFNFQGAYNPNNTHFRGCIISRRLDKHGRKTLRLDCKIGFQYLSVLSYLKLLNFQYDILNSSWYTVFREDFIYLLLCKLEILSIVFKPGKLVVGYEPGVEQEIVAALKANSCNKVVEGIPF